MKIRRIEIEQFGCFSDFKIDLEEGFNLIYGINGKGKSTLMAFIKMMFYSKGGNEKSADLLKNHRKKYRPWDGSPMSGAIVFEHEGCDYRLHKTFGKSPSSDVIQLWNTTKGTTVPLSVVCDAGNLIFGMSAAEFDRSIFIDCSGGFSDQTQDFGLESRIENLSLTGDEDISQRKVLDRLAAAKEELISKSGKKGMIVELESEISVLQSKKDLLMTQITEQSALNEQIALLEAEIAKDEKSLESLSRADKLQGLQSELNVYKLLLEKLNSLKAVEDKKIELNTVSPSHDRLRHAKLTRRCIILFILTALFVGFFAAGLFFSQNLYGWLILSFASLIFAISERLALMRLNKKPTDAERILSESEAMLRRDIKTITETAGLNEDTAFNVSAVEQKIGVLTDFIEKNSVSVTTNAATVTPALIHQKHNALNELYRRQVMPDGDMNHILTLITKKTDELKNLRSRYDSLCIALEVLEDAISETDSGLGAFLSQRTGEYLRVLNSGKYCDALVSETLDVELKDSDKTRYIHWRYLSQGYIDRTYLALRLATADAHPSDKDAIPLFLDDVFSQYDEESCERALLLLKNRMEVYGGQTLFFTCHKSILGSAKEVFGNFGEIYI